MRGQAPTSLRGLVAGTVLRDYSFPSTQQEVSKALTPGDALATFLEACRAKQGASEATRRKWRRQLERRSS
jgi:hypothetical protein